MIVKRRHRRLIVALFVIIIIQKVLVSAGGLYRYGKQKTKHKWGRAAVKKKLHPKPSDKRANFAKHGLIQKNAQERKPCKGPG